MRLEYVAQEQLEAAWEFLKEKLVRPTSPSPPDYPLQSADASLAWNLSVLSMFNNESQLWVTRCVCQAPRAQGHVTVFCAYVPRLCSDRPLLPPTKLAWCYFGGSIFLPGLPSHVMLGKSMVRHANREETCAILSHHALIRHSSLTNDFWFAPE